MARPAVANFFRRHRVFFKRLGWTVLLAGLIFGTIFTAGALGAFAGGLGVALAATGSFVTWGSVTGGYATAVGIGVVLSSSIVGVGLGARVSTFFKGFYDRYVIKQAKKKGTFVPLPALETATPGENENSRFEEQPEPSRAESRSSSHAAMQHRMQIPDPFDRKTQEAYIKATVQTLYESATRVYSGLTVAEFDCTVLIEKEFPKETQPRQYILLQEKKELYYVNDNNEHRLLTLSDKINIAEGEDPAMIKSKIRSLYNQHRPSIATINAHFKALVNSVIHDILYCEDLDHRTLKMENWLRIADVCNKENNYHCYVAIMTALRSPAINRLSTTKKGLSKEARSILRCQYGSHEEVETRLSCTKGIPYLPDYMEAHTRAAAADKDAPKFSFATQPDKQIIVTLYTEKEKEEKQHALRGIVKSAETKWNRVSSNLQVILQRMPHRKGTIAQSLLPENLMIESEEEMIKKASEMEGYKLTTHVEEKKTRLPPGLVEIYTSGEEVFARYKVLTKKTVIPLTEMNLGAILLEKLKNPASEISEAEKDTILGILGLRKKQPPSSQVQGLWASQLTKLSSRWSRSPIPSSPKLVTSPSSPSPSPVPRSELSEPLRPSVSMVEGQAFSRRRFSFEISNKPESTDSSADSFTEPTPSPRQTRKLSTSSSTPR